MSSLQQGAKETSRPPGWKRSEKYALGWIGEFLYEMEWWMQWLRRRRQVQKNRESVEFVRIEPLPAKEKKKLSRIIAKYTKVL